MLYVTCFRKLVTRLQNHGRSTSPASSVQPNLNQQTVVSQEEKQKMLERWEAVFFSSDGQKLEFEKMFEKKISGNDNELYMSWLPLKLGAIGVEKQENNSAKILSYYSKVLP